MNHNSSHNAFELFLIRYHSYVSLKWSYDPRSCERNFCNCVKKPEKLKTSTGFEPVTSWSRSCFLWNVSVRLFKCIALSKFTSTEKELERTLQLEVASKPESPDSLKEIRMAMTVRRTCSTNATGWAWVLRHIQ